MCRVGHAVHLSRLCQTPAAAPEEFLDVLLGKRLDVAGLLPGIWRRVRMLAVTVLARAEWAEMATAIMMGRYRIVFSFVPGDLERPAEIET